MQPPMAAIESVIHRIQASRSQFCDDRRQNESPEQQQARRRNTSPSIGTSSTLCCWVNQSGSTMFASDHVRTLSSENG